MSGTRTARKHGRDARTTQNGRDARTNQNGRGRRSRPVAAYATADVWLRTLRTLGRAPRLRTVRAFAEAEIVLPTGPFAGYRFKCERQPYAGILLDEMAREKWQTIACVGPTQSGKSLTTFVIPVLYHLFEMRETVVLGAPTLDLANDKWREDLRPVIEAGPLRRYLPKIGQGADRGQIKSAIRFENGVTLRFMTGGAGDKARAGYTSRILAATEVDGFDTARGGSRETDPLEQMKARTRAFGTRARHYEECTASISAGRIWTAYTGGTRSRLLLPCPHCGGWVLPEREHLKGWQAAENERQAADEAGLECPACAVLWNEDDRHKANTPANLRLVHEGQEIDAAGNVRGEAPDTTTLGFRWTATHNNFTTLADLGREAWRAARAVDEESAEKKQRQFVWALPFDPAVEQLADVTAAAIVKRQAATGRGVVPAGTTALVAATDLGKFLNHWVLVAFDDHARGTVIDYGRMEVASPELGEHRATVAALREWAELLGGSDGRDARTTLRRPDLVLIDARYAPTTAAVKEVCAALDPVRWRPSFGYGAGDERTTVYRAPRPGSKVGDVVHAGRELHVTLERPTGTYSVHVNADYWKSRVHERLLLPTAAPLALQLFAAGANEHTAIAKHWVAEKQVREFVAGKGERTTWQRVHRNNHWFDAIYNALAAAELLGVEAGLEQRRQQPPAGGPLAVKLPEFLGGGA